MSDFDSYDYDAGEEAYNAYDAELRKQGSQFADPVLHFRDLSKVFQDCWTAAAKAVKRRYGAIY